MGSKKSENGSMKPLSDIPENGMSDAMRFTKAKTRREAVVRVLEELNRRVHRLDLAHDDTHFQQLEQLDA